MTVEACEHPDIPFEKLVDDLAPNRDLSRSPLFQVMLVLQNASGRAGDVSDLRVADIDLGYSQSAAFDLTLTVDEQAAGLNLLMVYKTGLFDTSTIERMLSSFESLLSGVVADADQRLSRLPLMSDAEARRLATWYGTLDNSPPEGTILERFESCVREMPEVAAILCEDRQLTYRQLDEWANRLAHYLQSFGAGPETLVGVCLERSPELIASLLGIWKAGAAYLPLDPSYPAARRTFMVQDSGTSLVLTRSETRDRVSDDTARVVCLDRERSVIEQQVADRPHRKATSNSLAYVLYTSGSTGKPKGVEVSHRSLVNHAVHLAERQALKPGDRVLQFLSLSFDASAEEIYPTLISGATLVLHPAPGSMGGAELLDFSRRLGVGTLHLAPPLSYQFIDAVTAEGAAAANHLQVFVTGGEPLPPDKLRQWCRVMGNRAKFLFCYGVTEATITSTIFEAPADAASLTAPRVPIGRPLANQRVYVLDAKLQPVPAGLRGEMYLGGVGVARGYRGRPELTDARFLPDPFAAQPGARMYRSGDLARFLPDGQLEFLGRLDQQVKIHGYRIEPGEIEVALSEHEAVREVVAMVREDPGGRQCLVAYFVPREGRAVTGNQLRLWLRNRFPDYLVPSVFVALDALPILPGGKIDRSALPSPLATRCQFENDYEPPRTREESELATIWAELMRRDRVGIHDNFFQLGGDSILSIQMISRAREAGLVITAKDVFLHQTIAELARVVGRGPGTRPPQGAGGRTGAANADPASLFGTGLDRFEPFQSGRAAGGAARLVQRDVAHCASATARAPRRLATPVPANGRRLAAIHRAPRRDGGIGPGRRFGPARGPADARHRAAAAELQTSLDLEAGPIARFAHFHRGPERSARLLMIIHHFAVDGVSWRILVEDLQLAAEAIGQEAAYRLPAKTISVRDWADWLHGYAQSEKVAGESAHWLTVLAADSRHVPRDLAGGENSQSSAATVTCRWSPADTRLLLQQVPQAYHTPIHEVLLTALAQTISAWTGRHRVRLDVEGHGREPLSDGVDLSRTVGWFTSLYPVALEVPPTKDIGEILIAIKEQLRRHTARRHRVRLAPLASRVTRRCPPGWRLPLVRRSASTTWGNWTLRVVLPGAFAWPRKVSDPYKARGSGALICWTCWDESRTAACSWTGSTARPFIGVRRWRRWPVCSSRPCEPFGITVSRPERVATRPRTFRWRKWTPPIWPHSRHCSNGRTHRARSHEAEERRGRLRAVADATADADPLPGGGPRRRTERAADLQLAWESGRSSVAASLADCGRPAPRAADFLRLGRSRQAAAGRAAAGRASLAAGRLAASAGRRAAASLAGVRGGRSAATV